MHTSVTRKLGSVDTQFLTSKQLRRQVVLSNRKRTRSAMLIKAHCDLGIKHYMYGDGDGHTHYRRRASYPKPSTVRQPMALRAHANVIAELKSSIDEL